MAKTAADIDLAEFIDHSFLNPSATPEQITQCCEEADRFGFPTVCIFPTFVVQATEILHNKHPQICTVIGFPTGAHTTATKLFESQEAIEHGATELDVVINLGWVKSGNTESLYKEMAEICQETGKTIKAILETSVLTDAEKKMAAEVCMDAGVAFLKTSTGWFGGATVADVQLLKEITKDTIGIKASGGIRTPDQAIALILAGATRLGTSYGPALVQQRGTLEEGMQ
ncbi:MAG: deoxyribose-phosphate aldolase [Oculatellaceae cyanobacterium Prado106]|jgi:deoxyribose-phosphate aldolase|nr:deoxyribose-phosphate aldolase [Oculatellaceae cyanobacterium Prado106]